MSLEEEQAYNERAACPTCGHQPIIEDLDELGWDAWCPIHPSLHATAETQFDVIQAWNKQIADMKTLQGTT